jgi:toxin-antitoxin system PIN domain toxin
VSRVARLDVHVLVALFDPEHVHHDLAYDWFTDQRPHGWATCAVTENGFVRVLSNPKYSAGPLRPVDVIDGLRTFCASGQHHFLADTLSITEDAVFDPSLIRGFRQLTDVYLLALATRAKGALATFDRTIPLGAVVGATAAHLTLIAPVDDQGS